MPFPQQLDFDKVAFQVYGRMSAAINGWLDGGLTTEEPFISRITEAFTRVPRKCDVGNRVRYTMRADWAILHRKGENSTDKFGADIAVTIYIEGQDLIKTALFQTKVSEDFEVRLEKDQLSIGIENPLTKGRSFVLAIDKTRQGVRIKKIVDLIGGFKEDAKTLGVSVADWMPLGEWLFKWFSCDIGDDSRKGDANSIERLLEKYVLESDRDEAQGVPWGRNEKKEAETVAPSLIPARTWLSFLFVEPDSEWLQ